MPTRATVATYALDWRHDMLGRIITMAAGRSIARSVGGVAAGPAGAVVGLLLPTVLRRLGPGGMIAAAIGGHVVRRAMKQAATVR